ncbi:hypothetical protein EXW96_05815 [Paenibacillus sp. JMULE4]|uniref:hypothetical protein n=1 Tax=Paenibacillus sp. JMULE4 TaxID=2518342 RepID=UPI00157644BB|nr:hypothetical protein [Paenibacillus sp. JMULE4]NTZ17096.1 hypothetical protein [Paenibacillus sp. JMULE4]
MSREDSYYRILQSVSRLQFNISLILEAKAIDASRSSQWLCHHISSMQFENQGEQVAKTVEIHDHLLEVIDGLTKMELALSKNLQALLGDQEGGGANDPGITG